jgi:carbamate kinase
MKKTAIVALGGNALLRSNQRGTIEEQTQNTYETMQNLVYLIKEGYNLVISHGNGPQVGNILMRNDAGESQYQIPQMPLDICVADSQGGIGYMLEKGLRNVLKEHGIDKKIVSLITMVEVDPKDTAFSNPTKRVGKMYSAEEAEKLKQEKGWIFKEAVKNGVHAFRRVVPSPKPLRIMNSDVVKALVEQGIIVIASGGGGIPVYTDENGTIHPVEAVIDKDSASSLLASTIGADEFYILTDVPYVYINYAKPDQKALEFLNKKDILKYIEQGVFGEGNMAPKINAALNFVENGGEKSVITESTKLEDKSYGTKITLEYEN